MTVTSSHKSRSFRPCSERLESLNPVSSLSGIAALALGVGASDGILIQVARGAIDSGVESRANGVLSLAPPVSGMPNSASCELPDRGNGLAPLRLAPRNLPE
jgi:hypothetical protein